MDKTGGLKDAAQGKLDGVTGSVTGAVSNLQGQVTGATNSITDKTSEIKNSLGSKASEIQNNVMGSVNVNDSLSSAAGKLNDIKSSIPKPKIEIPSGPRVKTIAIKGKESLMGLKSKIPSVSDYKSAALNSVPKVNLPSLPKI